MESDRGSVSSADAALEPLTPGALIRLTSGPLTVDIAPAAGGRIAQIVRDDIEWLIGYSERDAAMIAWGSYPMLPWAGRVRRGRFDFDGSAFQIPVNFGGHAIHGVGLALPWRVEARSPVHTDLSLHLPEDQRWPFGGAARQRIEVSESAVRLRLSVTAEKCAMPAVIGWHPWFRKPDRLEFKPSAMYPLDAEGIAVRPLRQPAPGPWDNCFVNTEPVLLERGGQRLRLTSNCTHWVVYDQPAHATCIEPQSGPPDAFNLEPATLAAGASIDAWFLLEWL